MKGSGPSHKAIYYICYLLAMLIFGTNGLLVAGIDLQGGQIVLFRTLIGGILLTAIVLFRGGFDRSAVRAEAVPLLCGGVALGLDWIALFEAYQLLNVSLATLIDYSGPMIVLVLSPLLFREKLTGMRIGAACLVAFGLICISGSIAGGGMSIRGLIVAFIAALLYAALIVFNKHISRTGGLQSAAIELDVAFVVVLLYVLLAAGLPVPQKHEIPALLVLGAVNTGLAYLLYFSGMQNIPAHSVALLSYVEPVSALLFAALFLKEAMSPIQLLGAVLILGGALLGEWKRPAASGT